MPCGNKILSSNFVIGILLISFFIIRFMNITPRAYQLAIYDSILQNGNSLVILPTGLGKTLIALMLIRDKMKGGKCLFLTPTKPLAKQHVESIKKILGLDENSVTLITGELSPEKRTAEYAKPIVISTPQTIRNDMAENRLNANFVLCIVDEAHRSVGDYAYVYVANKLSEQHALIVGLTASPGGKQERIKEVMDNLHIANIEIRTTSDEDVKPYVQRSFIRWMPIMLSPTLKLIKVTLDEMISKYAHALGSLGFPPPLRNKGMFIKLRERILNLQSGIKYPALVNYSVLLNLLHMSELIETQGMHALRQYVEKLKQKETKSGKLLLREQGFAKIGEYLQSDEEHPKLKVMIELIKSLPNKKIIVFAQYRDQVKLIEQELIKNGIPAKQFLGKKDKYTRKLQEETIAAFRNGEFDVLCASSIGEEGIDIPSVDAVVFYEPIPSEIRSIQRRGRAARLKEGEIYILMTKGTRDEYFYWSAINKERKMKTIISSMQNKLRKESGQPIKAEKNLQGQTKIKHFF